MSPDGRWVFAKQIEDLQTILLTVGGQRYGNVLDDSQHIYYGPTFSTDGKWIAFLNGKSARQGRVYVAAFQGGTSIPRSAWIPLTSEEGYYGVPRWSPDGQVVYYFSSQDGFRCLYARRLDLSHRRALGEPIAIHHAHDMPQVADDSDRLAVADDKLVFNIYDGRANVWLAELPPE
jgi:eukaryotic-like serine/threonine-protein kinase